MKNLFIAAAILAAFGAPQALAQSKEFKGGFVLGVEAGYSQLTDDTAAVATSLVNTVGGSATVTQDKNIYFGRLIGGYKIAESFEVELGYIQSSTANLTFNGVSRTAVAYSGKLGVVVSGFDYSMLVRPSISTGMNGLFGRFGGVSLKADRTLTLATGATSGATVSSLSGTGYQFGFGYDAAIDSGVDLRVSYTRLQQIAGQSGSNANLFSVGILKKF